MQPAAFWGNLIGYQLVWLVSVMAAGRGTAWPGICATGAFVLWQLATSEHYGGDMRVLAVAVVLGAVTEGTLAGSGWASYAAREPAVPLVGAPLWILALWAAFSMTLNGSLASLRVRPVLAAILGATGAPVAYLGAQRTAHAITFSSPEWHGLVCLGASWGFALPLLSALARCWSAPRRGSGNSWATP